MTDAIPFLHLTDLHLAVPGDRGPLTDTTATFGAVLERIAAIRPAPAFIVISGDLTDRGDEASYRLLRQMLTSIDLPVLVALGNHDSRPGFYRGMLGRDSDDTAPWCHDALVAGVHVITLDSHVPGRIGGALQPETWDFLDAALARHAAVAKLVVVHHPPALEDAPAWHSLNWPDSQELARRLRGRGVAGLLCGHVHTPRIDHWHGVPVITGPGLHNLIDPLETDGLRITDGGGFGPLPPAALGAERRIRDAALRRPRTGAAVGRDGARLRLTADLPGDAADGPRRPAAIASAPVMESERCRCWSPEY